MFKLSLKFLFLIQILQLIFVVSLAFAPLQTSAADLQFKPEVPIPGAGEIKIEKSTKPIAEYINAIYKYAIGIVGVVSAIVLMIGGAIWITAGGNSERVENAKGYIASSLTGLILALLAYSILNTINPALVNFKITEIKNVEGLGCCEQPKSGGSCSIGISKDQCKSGWKEKGYGCVNNKCTASNQYVSCDQKGEYCEINGKAGWCDKKICQLCIEETRKCDGILSDYQCCGGKCESVNGNYICNHAPESDCTTMALYEVCTTEKGGKGYCFNNQCKDCGGLGIACDDNDNICCDQCEWDLLHGDMCN